MAVGYTGFENIVVAAVVVVEQVPALGGGDNEFVQLLVEVEQAAVHQVVGYHRNDRIGYHLGVVDRN